MKLLINLWNNKLFSYHDRKGIGEEEEEKEEEEEAVESQLG